MEDIFFWLAAINLTIVVVISAYLIIGGRTVEHLRTGGTGDVLVCHWRTRQCS